jgi:hypothetical protein
MIIYIASIQMLILERSAFYLDLNIEIVNTAILKNKLYDKRDDFTFPIVDFPFIISNITATLAYGVYISQFIRYSSVCAQYSDCLARAQLVTQRLLKQGYVAPRLKLSQQKLYGRHHNLVDRYEISISQMTMDLLLFT